ncbi:MAG: protease HtpX [Gammaproteobacteria bacterium]|nr:MAG: protease HtpX [Gammaproteobacteria bacterium]RLA54142.1 MAG: protease HtpX [Gammaproteobacteria bacterium]
MLRIGLFLATNIAILVLFTLIFQVFGLEDFLATQGIHSNMTSLLIMCGFFGFAGSFISLLLSKKMAKMGTRTQIIDEPANAQQRWLVDTVKELARKADIGMPEVGIFPAQQSNAFATGWNKNKALVAVSAGLLDRFSPDEARAVLAHEIGHVANGDMVTLTLIQGVVNTFVMFFARIIGSIIDKAVFKNDRPGIGYFGIVLVLQVVLGILASTIVMAFSRWREYRADVAGATLANRSAMIGALRRLQAESEAHVPNELPDTLTALGISSGWKKHASKLWMSHPPLEQRIAALQRGV